MSFWRRCGGELSTGHSESECPNCSSRVSTALVTGIPSTRTVHVERAACTCCWTGRCAKHPAAEAGGHRCTRPAAGLIRGGGSSVVRRSRSRNQTCAERRAGFKTDPYQPIHLSVGRCFEFKRGAPQFDEDVNGGAIAAVRIRGIASILAFDSRTPRIIGSFASRPS